VISIFQHLIVSTKLANLFEEFASKFAYSLSSLFLLVVDAVEEGDFSEEQYSRE
jgi:hypothetical protein